MGGVRLISWRGWGMMLVRLAICFSCAARFLIESDLRRSSSSRQAVLDREPTIN